MTYLQNILKWGVGCFNVDATRISLDNNAKNNLDKIQRTNPPAGSIHHQFDKKERLVLDITIMTYKPGGRYPANLIIGQALLGDDSKYFKEIAE